MGKYTVPTGDGYMGVWKTSAWSASVAIGTYQWVDWISTDDVFAIEQDVDGFSAIAIVEDPPDDTVSLAEGYLAKCNVKKTTTGTSVQVPGRALRKLEGFEPGMDIRAYKREEGGLTIVPKEGDPFV